MNLRVIRSIFQEKIKEAFEADPEPCDLLLAPFFRENILSSHESWRRICV